MYYQLIFFFLFGVLVFVSLHQSVSSKRVGSMPTMFTVLSLVSNRAQKIFVEKAKSKHSKIFAALRQNVRSKKFKSHQPSLLILCVVTGGLPQSGHTWPYSIWMRRMGVKGVEEKEDWSTSYAGINKLSYVWLVKQQLPPRYLHSNFQKL